MAKEESKELMASSPLFMSEFYMPDGETLAWFLARFSDLGCSSSTYWQYVDTDYTQTSGWYMYPPSVTQYGEPISRAGDVNPKAWAAYEKTVADGSYWGGLVCGAGGGQNNVLSKLHSSSISSPDPPSPPPIPSSHHWS
eukprot:s8989_g1.t1